MESERIYLRPVGPEDAELLLSWGQDPYYQETAGFAQKLKKGPWPTSSGRPAT